MDQALWGRAFIQGAPEAALCSIYPKRKCCTGRRRLYPKAANEGLAGDLTRYQPLTDPGVKSSLLCCLGWIWV